MRSTCPLGEGAPQTGIVRPAAGILAQWMLFIPQAEPAVHALSMTSSSPSSATTAVFSLGDSLRPRLPARWLLMPPSLLRLKTLGSSRRRRAGSTNIQVMVEGPGHVPDGPDRVQTSKKSRWRSGAAKAHASMWFGFRWCHRHRPAATTTSPAQSARRWQAGTSTAMHLLRDRPRKPGRPNARQTWREGLIATKIAAARLVAPTAPATARARRDRRRRLSRAPLRLSTGTASRISRSIPNAPKRIPRETLPADIYRRSRFLLNCAAPSTARCRPRSPDEDLAGLGDVLKAQEQSKAVAGCVIVL